MVLLIWQADLCGVQDSSMGVIQSVDVYADAVPCSTSDISSDSGGRKSGMLPPSLLFDDEQCNLLVMGPCNSSAQLARAK